jgi:peptide/nickel transport system substrate-binding protein
VSDSPFNLNGFSNPEFDRLFREARAETDDETRADLVIEALDLWVDPPNNIPLYTYPERLFMNQSITGAPTSFPTFLGYPWAADLAGTGTE